MRLNGKTQKRLMRSKLTSLFSSWDVYARDGDFILHTYNIVTVIAFRIALVSLMDLLLFYGEIVHCSTRKIVTALPQKQTLNLLIQKSPQALYQNEKPITIMFRIRS